MSHSVTASPAVNDPDLIDDDNIRGEPVVPVVLFIIDNPPAVTPIGRLGHSHAGLDHRWLRVCQLLPRIHLARLQAALGRMGGGETDDLPLLTSTETSTLPAL
jgi:hypothetical protein